MEGILIEMDPSAPRAFYFAGLILFALVASAICSATRPRGEAGRAAVLGRVAIPGRRENGKRQSPSGVSQGRLTAEPPRPGKLADMAAPGLILRSFPVGGDKRVIDEDSGKNERAGPQTPPFVREVCTDCKPRANSSLIRMKRGFHGYCQGKSIVGIGEVVRGQAKGGREMAHDVDRRTNGPRGKHEQAGTCPLPARGCDGVDGT